MFEHRSEKILPKKAFAKRMVVAFSLTLLIVLASVAYGTCGYRWIEGWDWHASFLQTCNVLGDRHVENPVTTKVGHWFGGIFVLYARLVFVTLVGFLMAPLLHRILHHLHFEGGEEGKKG